MYWAVSGSERKRRTVQDPSRSQLFDDFYPPSVHPESFFCFRIRWILKRNYSEKSFSAMNDYKFVKVRRGGRWTDVVSDLETLFSRLICGKVWLILERKKKLFLSFVWVQRVLRKSRLRLFDFSSLAHLAPSRSGQLTQLQSNQLVGERRSFSVDFYLCGLSDADGQLVTD